MSYQMSYHCSDFINNFTYLLIICLLSYVFTFVTSCEGAGKCCFSAICGVLRQDNFCNKFGGIQKYMLLPKKNVNYEYKQHCFKLTLKLCLAGLESNNSAISAHIPLYITSLGGEGDYLANVKG